MNSDIFPLKKPVIALVGPTAIGKTELSLEIAEKFNCEIISLDSMQVYRYMDIGTAKASTEERRRVVHHLLDIVDPDEHYDASKYVTDALDAIQAVHSQEKMPLITGGTGLYLRALISGLFEIEAGDEQLREKLHQKLSRIGSSKLHEELDLIDSNIAQKIHKNDTHRLIRALEIYYSTGINWSTHIDEQLQSKQQPRFERLCTIGLTTDREKLYKRINERTTGMLRAGLLEEVQKLLSMGYHRELKSMQSIGYRHMIEHLLDSVSYAETERLLARDTRRYAKRQYTWFRKSKVEWLDVDNKNKVYQAIDVFLQKSN